LTSDGSVNAAVAEANLSFNGSSLTVTGSVGVSGNMIVGGTLTAQEFYTEFVSASIIFESGSTKFGDSIDDTHKFTGSLFLTGSGTVTGSFRATSFTGSLQGTASYATYAVTTKGGAVAAVNFAGLPLRGTVTFGSAYPDLNYSISIVGGDARSWTIENKAVGGFIINTNSNVALANEVYWITTPYNS